MVQRFCGPVTSALVTTPIRKPRKRSSKTAQSRNVDCRLRQETEGTSRYLDDGAGRRVDETLKTLIPSSKKMMCH